jgi:hypothetical protein
VLKLIGDIFWELIDDNRQILDDMVTKLKDNDVIFRLVSAYGNDRNTIDKLGHALAKLKNSNQSSKEM